MKLLNCHIYNFGKYHDKKFDLSNDLHEIFLKNGEGKTTLVSFIVAIFFGGEVENIQSLLTKYESIDYPHGLYGGEISFIYNNEEYKLVHTFSKKQNKEKYKSDTLELTKKGSSFKEKRFEDDSPITYFFKDIEKPTSAILNTVILSHESFSKKEDEESLDDLFSSQLGDLYDLKEFDDIEKSIDKKIKEYGNPKAKNTVYSNAVNEQNDVSEQLKIKDKEIKEKKAELNRLFGADDLRKIGGYVASCDKDIESIEKEIETLKLDSSKIDVYQEYNQNKQLLAKKEEELENLNKKINNQPISDAILTKLDNLNDEVKNGKKKVEALLNEQKSIKVDEQYLKISEQEVAKIKKTYEEYKANKNILNNGVELPSSSNTKPLNKMFMFLTVLFLLIAVVGVCLLSVLEEPTFYLYILLGVGGVGLVVSLVCLFVSYRSKNKSNIIDTSQSLEGSENKEILEKKKVLEDFFAKLRLSTSDIKYSYETFLNYYEKNISLYKKAQELQKEINSLTASLENKENALVNELIKFGYDRNESFDLFLFQLKNTNKFIIEKSKEINLTKNKLNDPKYKDFDKLDITQFSYQSNQDLISNLNKKKIELLDKRREILNEMNEYNKLMEERRILEDKYYELRNTIWHYGDLAKLYKKGKKFLVEAKESIYASTYEPFIKELNKILDKEKTNETFFNSYEIKTDKKASKIVFKNNGVEKTSASLSQGYQDYLKLAVRFSFLNMTYKNEKPFIILDDPLVNMDKDRLNNIKTIIKTLSKSYQIIYFYCHESRKIN